MKVRFQADADFNQNIVRAMRRRVPAVDFQTAREAGLQGLGQGHSGSIFTALSILVLPQDPDAPVFQEWRRHALGCAALRMCFLGP